MATASLENPNWKLQTGAGLEIQFGYLAMSTLAAAPPEAAERFGVLLGRRVYDGRMVVEITGCETLWVARAGLRIAGRERNRIRKLLLAGGPPMEVVGLFRAQTASTLVPGPFEMEIAGNCFKEPGGLFLVLGGNGLAAMWFRAADGSIKGMAAPAPFPFAGSGGRAALAQLSAPARRKGRRALGGTLLAGGLVGVLAAALWVGTAAGTRQAAQTEVRNRTELGGRAFTVERQQGGLKVEWNPGARFFQGATGAILVIDDGPESKVLSIDLRSQRGELLYIPRSGDVEFRMRTLGPAERSETVHVIGAGPASELPPAALPQVPPGFVYPPAALGRQPRPGPEPAPQPRPQQPFRAPEAASAKPADIPEPPPIEVQGFIASTAVPVPAPPAAPAPAAAAPVAAGPYVPARLIDASRLLLRRAERAMLRGGKGVTIKVRVDERGRVVGAEADPIAGVPPPVLTELEKAALLCRFEPARQGDTPAPSRFTIQFRIR